MTRLRTHLVAMLAVALLAGQRSSAQVPDHLECYKIKDSAPRTTYTADLAGLEVEPGCQVKVPAKLLCVATTKSNVSPTPPEAGNGSAVGRSLCYKVKCPKGAPDALTIRDQFGNRSVEPKVSKLLCSPELSLCGNGMTDAGEACDDGNTTTETECPYGEAPCARCDATCSTDLNLTGPRCGDGSVDSLFEQCDDNNDSSCGTCNAPCKVFQLSSASGFILAVQGASLTDGETFTLDYGFSSTVFEFDTVFDGVAPGNAQIVVSPAWSAAQVAEEITSQINNTPPFIVSASRQSNMVSLTSIQGSPGNQPIIETVSDTEFVATGMQGGAGRDCLSGVGCGSDDDCASGTCGSQVPGECD